MTVSQKNLTKVAQQIIEKYNVSKYTSVEQIREMLDQLINEYQVPPEEAKKSVIRKLKDSGMTEDTNSSVSDSNGQSVPDSSDFEKESVTTGEGRALTIGSELGGGKEGTVYAVQSESDLAVKVFKQDRIENSRMKKKIEVMLNNRPVDKRRIGQNDLIFAWPVDTVYYDDIFIGYLMPRVETDNRSNIRTYIRKQLSASGDLKRRIKLSYNLASAVYFVHRCGYAVGDFNYENIFVSDDKDRVTLIDCDSYSIADGNQSQFHGSTMYEETVPPEKRETSSMQGAQMADSFNLAVWLFRILHPTEHAYLNPFQAKGSLATSGKLVEMMRENPFPYWNPKADLIEPTSGQSTYTSLPIGLRVLFESAFLGGKYHPYKRPSPGVWRDVLINYYRWNDKSGLEKGSRKRIDQDELSTNYTQCGPSIDFSQVNKLGCNESFDEPYESAEIVGKIKSVTPLHEFNRDEANEENDREQTGFVSNVVLENATGRRRLTFWDKQAVVAARSLHPGLVIHATGEIRPEDYIDEFDQQLYVDEFSAMPTFDNCPSIEELSVGDDSIHARGQIVGMRSIKRFDNNGSSNAVLNLVIADGSGHAHVTLWGKMAERLKFVPSGLTLEIIDGYVKQKDGQTTIEISEDCIPPVVSDLRLDNTLKPTPICTIEDGDVVDVGGVITDVQQINEYSGNKKRELKIQDETDSITVNIWGDELATEEYNKGDKILVTGVEGNSDYGDTKLNTQVSSVVVFSE
ncbi:hypothetical protein [Halohasta salina]|uniref:hypothetical protein n=1 Tax=Halohasta salina TaxID=2961621 RepID=UPI0020A43210|nr:hypothetical protein [Halohasta salina]